MESILRIWEPTRATRKGRYIAHNNGRCQAVIKDDVPTREH
jgi:hypothetical protein